MSSPLSVIYEFGRFRLDRGNQRLTKDGLLVATPGRTLPILVDLIANREQIVSIEKLVENHFPKSPFGEEELTGEVLKLKRLLDDTTKTAPMIRFILGQGYQFDAEVNEYLGDAQSGQDFGNKAAEVAPEPVVAPKSNNIGKMIGVVVAIVAAVAISGGVWRYFSVASSVGASSDYSPDGPPRIAILPFQSLTGQVNDDSFNRSLTEAIFTALSKQSDLKVVPEEQVRHYVESGVADPVSAGQQLGASMIVRGMAQRLVGRVLVKVQLVNARDGSQMWSSSFEGNSNELGSIAEQISQKIKGSSAPQ